MSDSEKTFDSTTVFVSSVDYEKLLDAVNTSEIEEQGTVMGSRWYTINGLVVMEKTLS